MYLIFLPWDIRRIRTGAEVPPRLPWQPLIILIAFTLFCVGRWRTLLFFLSSRRERETDFVIYFSNTIQHKKSKEKQWFMPSLKLLKTWVYNENTNRCLVVKSRGVVAMVSDGREGSWLFKLSGSVHVETHKWTAMLAAVCLCTALWRSAGRLLLWLSPTALEIGIARCLATRRGKVG